MKSLQSLSSVLSAFSCVVDLGLTRYKYLVQVVIGEAALEKESSK